MEVANVFFRWKNGCVSKWGLADELPTADLNLDFQRHFIDVTTTHPLGCRSLPSHEQLRKEILGRPGLPSRWNANNPARQNDPGVCQAIVNAIEANFTGENKTLPATWYGTLQGCCSSEFKHVSRRTRRVPEDFVSPHYGTSGGPETQKKVVAKRKLNLPTALGITGSALPAYETIQAKAGNIAGLKQHSIVSSIIRTTKRQKLADDVFAALTAYRGEGLIESICNVDISRKTSASSFRDVVARFDTTRAFWAFEDLQAHYTIMHATLLDPAGPEWKRAPGAIGRVRKEILLPFLTINGYACTAVDHTIFVGLNLPGLLHHMTEEHDWNGIKPVYIALFRKGHPLFTQYQGGVSNGSTHEGTHLFETTALFGIARGEYAAPDAWTVYHNGKLEDYVVSA
eukprot:scaffold7349_cov173-Amphora_coffeaeformis.AAC.104